MSKRTKTTRPPRPEDTTTTPALYITDPDAGHCVVADEHHPHDRDGVPIPVAASAGQMCTGHRFDLDFFVDEIKALWFDLAVLVAPGNSGLRGGPRSKSPDPAAAIDLVAAALRDHRNPPIRAVGSSDIPSVPAEVASWLMLLANEKPLLTYVRPHIGWRIHPDGRHEKIRRGRARGVLPSSVIAQLDILARNHGWIAQQPWAGLYWSGLKQVRDAMREKVGEPSSRAERHVRSLAQEIVDAASRR